MNRRAFIDSASQAGEIRRAPKAETRESSETSRLDSTRCKARSSVGLVCVWRRFNLALAIWFRVVCVWIRLRVRVRIWVRVRVRVQIGLAFRARSFDAERPSSKRGLGFERRTSSVEPRALEDRAAGETQRARADHLARPDETRAQRRASTVDSRRRVPWPQQPE